jgi:hypothetical protein
MKLEVLLSGLNNPQPAVRLDVVRVLGMLDETRALEPLRERYKMETDPQVREAIAWAGKRLYQALQAGYSTVDELFQYFRIDREIETMPDVNEQEMLRRMEQQFDSDMRDMQKKAGRRKAGMAIAAGLAGGMVGAGAGMRMMMDTLKPGADAASSALGQGERVVQRTPATLPTNANIDIWVKRLKTSPRAEDRENAVIELQQLNNPRALPPLALVFVTDDSPKVRQAAQRYGKILYWSAVYWDMEQSGALAEEMRRRAEALGKAIKVDTQSDTAQPDQMPAIAPGQDADAAPGAPAARSQEDEVDVAEILRKAKEGRKRRKSRGR